MLKTISLIVTTISLFIGALPINFLGFHISIIIIPFLLVIHYKEFVAIDLKFFSELHQLFFAIFLIPLVLSSFNTLTNASLSVRDFVALFSPLMLILSILLWNSIILRHGVRVTAYLYITLALIVMFIGILQFFQFTPVTEFISVFEILNEKAERYFLHNLRARSIFPANPNGFAVFCLSVLFLTKFITNRFLKLLVVSTSIIAIILSGSMAVLCLTTVLLIILNVRFAIFLSPLALLVGYIVLWPYLTLIIARQKLSENIIPSSLLSRIRGYWLDTWHLIIENPFIGIGPSTERMTFSSDSFYLDFILKNGFIGFGLLLMSIFVFVQKFGIRNYTFFYLMFGITASLFRNDQLNFLLSFVFAVTAGTRTYGKEFGRK